MNDPTLAYGDELVMCLRSQSRLLLSLAVTGVVFRPVEPASIIVRRVPREREEAELSLSVPL